MKKGFIYLIILAGFTSFAMGAGDIEPPSANGQNLGTSSKPFGTIYVTTNGIPTGGYVISVNGTNMLTITEAGTVTLAEGVVMSDTLDITGNITAAGTLIVTGIVTQVASPAYTATNTIGDGAALVLTNCAATVLTPNWMTVSIVGDTNVYLSPLWAK